MRLHYSSFNDDAKNPGTITRKPQCSRFSSWVLPAQWVLFAATYLPEAFYSVVVSQRRPQDIFRFSRWQDDLFGAGWSGLAPLEELDFLREKKRIVEGVKGSVIEIGPGNNPYLQYMDKTKISHIYGIEPNASLHETLLKRVKELGWEDKYTLLSCGIEDEKGMANVPPADSVLSIQCLCSTPSNRAIYRALHRLLKPGGELRIFEHVQSNDRITKRVQSFYDYFWHIPFGGCNLSRPTAEWLQDVTFMGFEESEGWSVVELKKLLGESPWSCMPVVYGRLVKK